MYPAIKREEINPWERFFRTLLAALNPRSYHSLSQRPLGMSLKYFFWTVIFAMGIMLLLAIPNLFNIAPYTQTELGHFTKLTADFQQQMSEPFVLTRTTPLLVIDTTNSTHANKVNVLITNHDVSYHLIPFTEPTVIPLGDGDLLANSGNISNLVWYLVLLMLPGLLLLMLLSLLVKYAVLALFAAFLGFILTGIIRFQIRFFQLLNVGIYATTIAIIIELFTKPFLVSSFYLHYVFFGIYFILGMIGAGDFEANHPKRMRQREEE